MQGSSYCRRPFTELNVEPDGTLAPCCLIKPANNNDFRQRDLESYLKSPELRELQRALSHNERPSACEICWNNESAGIESLRAPEPSRYRIEENKFREVHIKISSVCNFKCRMCGPFSSSAWLVEQKKFDMGMQDVMAPIPADSVQYALKDPKFRREMFDLIIPNTQLIRISGGEPLLCAHSLDFFKELAARGLTNKQMLIYTNLSALKFAGVDYLDFWKQFPKLKLLVSCDGAGESVEYSRTGLVWSEFVENLKKVKDRVHSINCVINIYSVYSIPELLRLCSELNIKIYFGSVFKPNMSVQILPLKEKEKIREFYNEFLLKESGRIPAEELEHVYNSVMKYMFSQDWSDSAEPHHFKRKNTELDRRRNTDFNKTFPQLSDWYSSI